MKLRHLYLLLCVLGTVLPLWQFYPFLLAHGLDVVLFLEKLFVNEVSGFFGMDVIVSGTAVIIYTIVEGRRLQIPHAWLALLGLCVGVSLALPLFLYMKQRHLDNR